MQFFLKLKKSSPKPLSRTLGNLLRKIRSLQIGQTIGLGFVLILVVASLTALLGWIAYEVSTRQRTAVEIRGEVERLTLELELLSVRRTEALDRYLISGRINYLAAYQGHQAAYADSSSRLQVLLSTVREQEALQEVARAELALDSKAQEILRLYNSGYESSARFLWGTEGEVAQDNLLQAIDRLRQVQGRTSQAILEQAQLVEKRTITGISIFIPIMLIGGLIVGFVITRSITGPLSELVKTINNLSNDLNTRVDPSGPHEIAFLGDTINQMATNLQASRQALQASKERLERELALASQIQTSFLPQAIPQRAGLSLAVFRQSARELGGDFFTFIELGSRKQGIIVGDVSGKGAPAAMAGALAVGLLEAQAPSYTHPEVLLAAMNRDLHNRLSPRQMNIACCYVIFDEADYYLTVANAGCVYPYLRRGNHLIEIDAYGMPLGMWPSFNYVSQSRQLYPGDLLMLSSDGLVEAKNEQGEMFGFERLASKLMEIPHNVNAQAAVDYLIKAVRNFTGPIELHDDLTVVMIQVV